VTGSVDKGFDEVHEGGVVTPRSSRNKKIVDHLSNITDTNPQKMYKETRITDVAVTIHSSQDDNLYSLQLLEDLDNSYPETP